MDQVRLVAAARLESGDCLEIIPRLVAEGVAVDAIVTDPPYHLIQGSRGGSVRQNDPLKPFGRAEARGGFMGQRWDGGDVAFRPETWASIGTALKPGGYLLAFGGTRTHHRIWCAIEGAGFVIQDTIMWLYGSGFPKGRTQLKPAFEPICVAYKPGGKRVLNIDECRISTESTTRPFGAQVGTRGNGFDYRGGGEGGSESGRWPANVCHDGSDEVMEAFAAFGESRSPSEPVRQGGTVGFDVGSGGKPREAFGVGFGDFGSAARFFYCAKAAAQDRWGSRHPTVKPIELIKWLVPLVTPKGGLVFDPFAGSGTTGVAALATGRSALLIEQDKGYIADIRERITFYEGEGRHSINSKNRHKNEPATGTLI
jgi:site-specific DNA-methyltransferase (adenine-specific)